MRIGLLGGTGPAGRGLAVRLAAAGHDVVVGSRDAARAAAACKECTAAWPGRDLSLEGAANAEAASADLLVVATPWDAASATMRECAEQVGDGVVLSMANALVRADREFQALVPPRGSVAASVQAAAPRARVVAACHHLPAKELADLDHRLEADVLLASDHADAKAVVSDVLGGIDGLRALDAGSLNAAGPIEAFTAVLLSLNSRYRTRASLRITGI